MAKSQTKQFNWGFDKKGCGGRSEAIEIHYHQFTKYLNVHLWTLASEQF